MEKFDLLIITNLPSFYKIKLFNEIGKYKKILVIYTWNSPETRNKDFFAEEAEFKSINLPVKNKILSVYKLIKLLHCINYTSLILGGWNEIYFWIGAFFSKKKKNSVIIESSYNESQIYGIKGIVKKLFLSRISKIYVPGQSNKKLCLNLGFKGKIIITKGVGIFNYHKQPLYQPRNEIKNFLYVGRFSSEKNLEYLINTFNTLPQFSLNLIGFGPLDNKLRKIANSNITFIGQIDNKNLSKYYQSNDVFILPSFRETWGLVVEEALNNGTPVILSNMVGCAEELMNGEDYGLVFDLKDEKGLEKSILKISDPQIYNKMRYNISLLNFEEIERRQINCYLDNNE